jgi:hypothetical protein
MAAHMCGRQFTKLNNVYINLQTNVNLANGMNMFAPTTAEQRRIIFVLDFKCQELCQVL